VDVKTNNAAVCPSCERFIGPADVCPYCEADSDKPPIIRRLRVAALLLAVVGLVFLYLMARNSDLPAVRIADMTPMMNFASVRINGTVESKVYIKRKGEEIDYLSFYVNDGTGELQVQVSRETARELAATDRIPEKGDRVAVAGTLNVSGEGKIRLRALRIDVGAPETPGVQHSTRESP